MEDLDTEVGTPRPATLKRINMRRFLEEIRRSGPSTRAGLTRAIGVTPPTSSSIIADLIARGLLEETDSLAVAKGRPGKVVRLASASSYVIGATIDVHECRITPAGLDGEPRPQHACAFKTPGTYEELLRALQKRIEEIRAETPGRCLGLGIAVPGLVDEARGKVALSPNVHFLDGKDLGPDLACRLEIQVSCTQEEHALCLCEQRIGQAQKLSDFAVMDFSTGVGMGVVSGGRYIAGANGFAGEIGHITVEPDGLLCGCGNRGCLETVASDTALLRFVSERKGVSASFSNIAELDCQQDLNRVLEFVAIGIASVINLFNPSAIFVYGKLFQLDDGALDQVLAIVRSRALRPSAEHVSIELAKGNKMYGATAGLLDRVFALVGPTLH